MLIENSKSPALGTVIESVLFHYRLGFTPEAITADGKGFGVERETWRKHVSEDAMTVHWNEHPDHRAAVELPDNVVLIAAYGIDAQRRLDDCLRHFGVPPRLMIDTAEGAHYAYFRVTERAASLLDIQSRSQNGTQLRWLRKALLELPIGTIVTCTASHIDELSELDHEDAQALIACALGQPFPVREEGAPLEDSTTPEADVSADDGGICKTPTEYQMSLEQEASVQLEPNDASHPLMPHSLRGMADTIAQAVIVAVFVLMHIALRGQSTMICAPPNTGKTLLMLHLLIQSILEKLIDPSHCFVLNCDDTAQGLAEKLQLADEYGFHMLAEGYQDFRASDLLPLLTRISDKGDAPKSIIILDTVKRFTNVMDKGAGSRFTKAVRQFVLKGGSLIGLAHTNKSRNAKGELVPEGTGDIINDFDCAYVVDTIEDTTNSNRRIVEFTNVKRRGGSVVSSIAFAYTLDRNVSYNELLASVEIVDPTTLAPLKRAAELSSDAPVIDTVSACIQDGIDTKMKLMAAVAESLGISQRAALKAIEKYTGDDPAQHRWTFSVRERGAKVYTLLDRPDGGGTSGAA